jgi:hypothetical protein
MTGAHFRVADTSIGKLFVAPDNRKPLPDDVIEAAITRVLEAEASARADVASARNEALMIAERAREQARRLGVTSDRRMRKVRAGFAGTVAVDVAALEAEATALGAAHNLTPADISRVETAVAALARALTGGPA